MHARNSLPFRAWPLIAVALYMVGTITTVIASASANAAQESEIKFGPAGGMRLAGTLRLPLTENGPFPAVLLLQGSGPVDRNGDQAPHLKWGTLELLAEHLAGRGIASLRYDKRGMAANADGRPSDPAQWPAFFSWEAFVGDASKALDDLRARPDIDAQRITVMGHSEGGLIALDLASRRGADVHSLVLLATPGRPLGAVITDQISLILKHQGATGQQAAEILAENARIQKEAIARGVVPGTISPGLRAYYPSYIGPFLKSVLVLKPSAMARQVRPPILAIHGRDDGQVYARTDAAALAAALEKRSDRSIQITIPGMNHALQNQPDVTAERRPLHPRLLAAIES